MLPSFVRYSIKWGFPPKEALDYEACCEKRFREIATEEGLEQAQKWLRIESQTCLAKGCVRRLRYLAFWYYFH